MSLFFFCIFAAIMLIFGILAVTLRNPVSCALSLVVSFLALAALYITLDAYFIGVVQVLVYAGAVMVLFLFIIMLLDLKAEAMRKINWSSYVSGIIVVVAFFLNLVLVITKFPKGAAPMPTIDMSTHDDVKSLGFLLFSDYNLPFLVIGVLILVATVGVVILSKRELK